MIDPKALQDLLDRRVLQMRAEGGSVALMRGTMRADSFWIELDAAPRRWKVGSKLLSEPVFDDDGARYYGDDLLTLVLERDALAPAASAHLVTLYTKPVAAVELYGGTIRANWVDKGILLRLADSGALLLSVETSAMVLTCGELAIAEVLAAWENDWPEIQQRQSLTSRL